MPIVFSLIFFHSPASHTSKASNPWHSQNSKFLKYPCTFCAMVPVPVNIQGKANDLVCKLKTNDTYKNEKRQFLEWCLSNDQPELPYLTHESFDLYYECCVEIESTEVSWNQLIRRINMHTKTPFSFLLEVQYVPGPRSPLLPTCLSNKTILSNKSFWQSLFGNCWFLWNFQWHEELLRCLVSIWKS